MLAPLESISGFCTCRWSRFASGAGFWPPSHWRVGTTAKLPAENKKWNSRKRFLRSSVRSCARLCVLVANVEWWAPFSGEEEKLGFPIWSSSASFQLQCLCGGRREAIKWWRPPCWEHCWKDCTTTFCFGAWACSCLEADLARQCCSFFQYTSVQDGAEEHLSFLLTMSNVLHYQAADGLGS